MIGYSDTLRGKGRSGKQQQEQNSSNLGTALYWSLLYTSKYAVATNRLDRHANGREPFIQIDMELRAGALCGSAVRRRVREEGGVSGRAEPVIPATEGQIPMQSANLSMGQKINPWSLALVGLVLL